MTKEEFINATEQFNYGCDAGSLGIVVNGMNFFVQNCYGDGDGTVYITDKPHYQLQSPFQDELVLTFGSYDKDAEIITVGLREYDIVTYTDPEMVLRGRHFSISRIRESKDFIIRVDGMQCVKDKESKEVSC